MAQFMSVDLTKPVPLPLSKLTAIKSGNPWTLGTP